MSLTVALNTALSGLNVSQQSLAVLSQNIANANTAGYSRQIVQQESLTLGGKGAGVSIKEVARRVDAYLTLAITQESSNLGRNATLADFAARMQILMGQPGNGNSIDSFTNVFFNNVRSLAQTPEDVTLRRTTVNSASALAEEMRSLAGSLQDLQFNADQEVGRSVVEVNNYLREAHALNQAIVSSKTLGRDIADLEDQRDERLRLVSEFIDIDTFERSNGAISVVTGSGISLLDDNLYQLNYDAAVSSAVFTSGANLAALTVQVYDADGNPNGGLVDLISSGTASSGTLSSTLRGGKIQGLVKMRDTHIPDILSQLDMMASTLRDEMNIVHNLGSGFPSPSTFTGTRLVNAANSSEWLGSTRIALLGADGQPLPSAYANETGTVPLTIDLANFITESGTAAPTTQELIDEINQFYGVPQPKVGLGNMNDIRLVSNSDIIPGVSSQFLFDVDLTNISGTNSNLYVTDVQIKDNLGVSTGAVTSTIPELALDTGSPNATYTTTTGSTTVTVSTSGAANNLQNGDVVFLSDPGVAVNGIPNGELTGYFTISNVTATGFEISTVTQATSTGGTNVASQTANPPYVNTLPGTQTRGFSQGQFTADLSANTTSPYYTVEMSVGVDDGTGNVVTSVISYRINNSESDLFGDRLSAVTSTGQAVITQPNSTQALLTATLVDADGVEIAKATNGKYASTENGYLKLTAASGTSIVIDSLDSAQQGLPNDTPAQAGTGRGFSHYFELNNFFSSNLPTDTGDTLLNSAVNLTVESRLISDPSQISLGSLIAVDQPLDPAADPLYTYQRAVGDNSIIQRISDLGIGTSLFATAGGLSQTTQTFSGYASQILSAAATNASSYQENSNNAELLLSGFTQRASAVSGVNLDTELANTVIYQNSYAASARVITVTSELFDVLLQSIR